MSALFDYAYWNGTIVYVDDVDNGVKCQCICPECGDKLIAHNRGKIMAHHFQHYNHVEHEINGMTRLHKLSQYIIAKKFRIEILYKESNFLSESSSKYELVDTVNKYNEVLFSQTLINGQIEYHANGNVIYDVYFPNDHVVIEIYVSHSVDDIKKSQIKRNGDICIELDLSWISRDISYDDLSSLLSILLINGYQFYKHIYDESYSRLTEYQSNHPDYLTDPDIQSRAATHLLDMMHYKLYGSLPFLNHFHQIIRERLKQSQAKLRAKRPIINVIKQTSNQLFDIKAKQINMDNIVSINKKQKEPKKEIHDSGIVEPPRISKRPVHEIKHIDGMDLIKQEFEKHKNELHDKGLL